MGGIFRTNEPRMDGVACPSLGVMAIAAAIVWAVKGIVTPFVIVVVAEAILTYWVRKKLDDTLHGTEHAFRDLDLLSGLLERFERHSFRGPQFRVSATRTSVERIHGVASNLEAQKSGRFHQFTT